jgi:hypothetical protein
MGNLRVEDLQLGRQCHRDQRAHALAYWMKLFFTSRRPCLWSKHLRTVHIYLVDTNYLVDGNYIPSVRADPASVCVNITLSAQMLLLSMWTATPLFIPLISNSLLHALHLGPNKLIGANKHVTLAFFYGIFITTIRKSWNYEKELCINNLNLRIYLVVIAWLREGIIGLN